RYGLHVVTPEESDRGLVHRVIYDELCRGQILEESRRQYRKILHRLAASGAEGIILGCTEISLLVRPEDSPVPLFDTTEIHARRAAELALESES
ncbi:MAG: amino acid racemase, partial [Thermoanaerobaculia bacterium]